MQKLYLALAALTLLCGGVAGLSKTAHAGGGEAAAGDAYGVEFVELDPVILPIVGSNGVSQVVSLVVVLEAKDGSVAAETRKMQPRLKDAFIMDMYGVLSRKASLEGGVLRVDKLKERLKKLTTKVMGEDKINDVLLQVVNQRPV